MKIKVQFEDDEYVHLAEEFTKLGLDLSLVSEQIDEYPIRFVSNSDNMTVAIHIRNTNFTKEIISDISAILYDCIGTGTIQDLCSIRFAEYFELESVEFPLLVS